jgi:hypothetical protein
MTDACTAKKARLMRTRSLTLLVIGLLVISAADWAACSVLQHRMRAEYAAWAATITSQGWSLRADKVSEGGFPFGATLTLSDFALSGGRAMLPGGLDWQAERVRLSISLMHFWRLTVEPQGEQTVRVASTNAVVFSADHLTASVPLGRDRGDRIALDADGLTAGLQRSRQRQDVRIDHLALGLMAQRKDAARITARADISASGIELPDNNRWPLGGVVENAGATIALASPALSGIAASDQARAWRDWGGVVTVENLQLGWGPLDLHAHAKLTLDDRLQPSGKGSATVSGWEQTIDALAASGTIEAGMAQTIKLVVGLMARAPANGQGGQHALSFPFTLKDSTLSIGKIPLIRLHSFAWGGV